MLPVGGLEPEAPLHLHDGRTRTRGGCLRVGRSHCNSTTTIRHHSEQAGRQHQKAAQDDRRKRCDLALELQLIKATLETRLQCIGALARLS